VKRNDIVGSKLGGGYMVFGRIIRRIDETHVEVVDCGKHITVYADEDLEVHNDYKGYWDTWGRADRPVFRRMPTLRKLKQTASYYQEAAWKKRKPTIRETEHRKSVAERIHAPFTDKQVIRLNEYQEDGQYAPLTCPHTWDRENDEREKAHDAFFEASETRRRGALEATKEGMVCPVCTYRQNWADPHMLIGKDTSKGF